LAELQKLLNPTAPIGDKKNSGGGGASGASSGTGGGGAVRNVSVKAENMATINITVMGGNPADIMRVIEEGVNNALIAGVRDAEAIL
jgi:hypothetical protein